MDKQPQNVSDTPWPAMSAWRWLVLLALALLLYPLSVGPFVFFQVALGYPPWMNSAMLAIYGPLEFVCDNNRTIDLWVQAYADAALKAGLWFR